MINKDKIVDSWLVLQTREGNKKALALLVKRWHKKLCKQALWYTKDMHSSKDVVQDCWPVIIKRMHVLKEPRKFGSWALSIVTRRSIDTLRKGKRETIHLAQYRNQCSDTIEQASPDTSVNRVDVVRKAIKELPEASQLVLNLFYLEALSIKEISQVLNVPEGTIKSRLFKAREKLKTILKQKYYEE